MLDDRVAGLFSRSYDPFVWMLAWFPLLVLDSEKFELVELIELLEVGVVEIRELLRRSEVLSKANAAIRLIVAHRYEGTRLDDGKLIMRALDGLEVHRLRLLLGVLQDGVIFCVLVLRPLLPGWRWPVLRADPVLDRGQVTRHRYDLLR